jgi:hypothetical protein
MLLRRTDEGAHHAGLIDALAAVSEAELREVVVALSHRPTDTPETLDYAFMRRVAQLLSATVARQARG